MNNENSSGIKELPESAFDYLIELWARSHNVEIVSVQKFPAGTYEKEKEVSTA